MDWNPVFLAASQLIPATGKLGAKDEREEVSPRGKEVVNPEKPISLLSYKEGPGVQKTSCWRFLLCFFFLLIYLVLGPFLSPLFLFWLIPLSFISSPLFCY